MSRPEKMIKRKGLQIAFRMFSKEAVFVSILFLLSIITGLLEVILKYVYDLHLFFFCKGFTKLFFLFLGKVGCDKFKFVIFHGINDLVHNSTAGHQEKC